MPIITSLGRGQHQFRNGSGLYTAGDVQRGTTPTPSQLARGITAADIDRRWWTLDQPLKRLWQQIAPAGMSGRRCYSVVNRMRLNGLDATSDQPPSDLTPPAQPALSGFIGYGPTDPGTVTYIYCQIPASQSLDRFKLSLYKPPSSPSDVQQFAAHWWFGFYAGYTGSAGFQLLGTLGPNQRGPNLTPSNCPSPGDGTSIRLRIWPSSAYGYPGTPFYTSLVVGPGPPPNGLDDNQNCRPLPRS